MQKLGRAILWLGYAMLAASATLFVIYILVGVKPNFGDVDLLRGPVLPFFLLISGVLTAFTGFMIRGAFSSKE